MQRKRTTSRSLKKVYSAIDSRFPEHLEQCRAFLRQKSVSATGEGIRETAEWVKCSIEELGGKVDLCGNPSFPIVFGRLDRGCPKTPIIYGMYDVQPAEEPNWINPPFEAEIHHFPGIEECVVARGAVNSKEGLSAVYSMSSRRSNVNGNPEITHPGIPEEGFKDLA